MALACMGAMRSLPMRMVSHPVALHVVTAHEFAPHAYGIAIEVGYAQDP